MSLVLSGSNGLTFPDSSTQAVGFYGFKNRIINGGMVIDQRNAGASVTPTNGQYLVDRWVAGLTAASKFSAQQNAGSVSLPAGFINYLGITSSSAYSVSSGDLFVIQQYIEGLNVSDLAWGTASAKTVTLSFQVYSSLTGTFGGSIANSGASRCYPFSYTVSSANTWTTISVTIPGDTTGTWLTTNGIGVTVRFGLGSGSTYSGTSGAWAGSNYIQPTSTVSVVGTSGATFYITGVQLEKGSTATSFDYRPYGTELMLCQRYAQVYTYTTASVILTGGSRSTTRSDGVFNFPVMRAAPTITLPAVGNSTGQATFMTGSLGYPGLTGTLSTTAINISNAFVSQSGDTGFTAGQVSNFYTSGGCTITFSAEL